MSAGDTTPGVLDLDAEARRLLVALAGCASTDIARPVLCHLAFDEFAVWATDTYVLGRVQLGGNGPAQRRLVPARDLASALRRAKARDDVRLEFTDDAALVTVESRSLLGGPNRTTVRLPYPSGVVEYPTVESLVQPMPGEAGTVQAGVAPVFNPRHVARVAALAPVGRFGAPAVRVRWADPLKPMHLESGDGALLGLVMPVRT